MGNDIRIRLILACFFGTWPLTWEGANGRLLGQSASASNQPSALSGDAKSELQVIQHVQVVDVEGGKILKHQQVLIRDRKIESITPMELATPIPIGARLIDAGGRYLIPGLFDAYVHLVSDLELFAPMLVAHGVTSVRDLGGPTELIMAYKRSARDR